MFFRMDQLLKSLSLGLDAIESELVGSTTNHGKRVAVLTASMGRSLGWEDDHIITLAACSLLHDNALTESLHEQSPNEAVNTLLASHCIKGEKNACHLPFPTDAKDIITFHHEYMDCSGPFEKHADKTPVGAQLIALADRFDVENGLKLRPISALDELREIVVRKKGVYFTNCAAEAMLSILDGPLLNSLKDNIIDQTFEKAMPVWNVDIQAVSMMKIAETVAAITDYKSRFTANHSLQIANRAYHMARFYGYDTDTCARVYLAAALHDVGKLVTPIDILEKPGKLTPEEFEVIKKHVHWSYLMLKDIDGLEEICRWAVTHHRKLGGTGYPELPAEFLELDHISRLMACIDIYQAVRETRPYHPARTHAQTMDIMWDMADKGEIDRQITADMDAEMAGFTGEGGKVPSPPTNKHNPAVPGTH